MFRNWRSVEVPCEPRLIQMLDAELCEGKGGSVSSEMCLELLGVGLEFHKSISNDADS
jgi:hypothetical protein